MVIVSDLIKISEQLPHPGIDAILTRLGLLQVAHLNEAKDAWVYAYDHTKTFTVDSFEYWMPYHWYEKEVENAERERP